MKNSTFSVTDFKKKKELSQKITMLTAYDHITSRLISDSGVDSILVGDSLGMVFQGHDSTLSVTMEDIIYHAKAVRRGSRKAFIIADMPFGSFHISKEKAVENACRLVKESGANAVKLEGGESILDKVKLIVQAGIPVLGHLGLLPQSVNMSGGYKIQGRDPEKAERLLTDAVSLESAGCFGVVLECVPSALASRITEKLKIPTIGIGAGSGCDGQVLVTEDMLGLSGKKPPSFVKEYANTKELLRKAIKSFIDDVLRGEFPDKDHSFE